MCNHLLETICFALFLLLGKDLIDRDNWRLTIAIRINLVSSRSSLLSLLPIGHLGHFQHVVGVLLLEQLARCFALVLVISTLYAELEVGVIRLMVAIGRGLSGAGIAIDIMVVQVKYALLTSLT